MVDQTTRMELRLVLAMQLLVSVRNLNEALVASQCGVDIIDVKEPRRGSLGAAAAGTLRQIAEQLRPGDVLSAAMGELNDRQRRLCPNGYTFAKIGLAGCELQPDWAQRWCRWANDISSVAQPVAVGYADFKRCAAPHPLDIAEAACREGHGLFLLDTHHKDGQCLFDLLTKLELANWIRHLHRLPMQVAVAGSLEIHHISEIAAMGAEIVAVRGAACQRSRRESTIVAHRIGELQKVVQQMNLKAAD